jgi:hypothetical protein
MLRLCCLLALVASSALALTLPERADLTFVTGRGAVVGMGKIDGGRLDLVFEAGFTGPATLLLTTPGGEATVVDVMIGRGGQVLVIDGEGIHDLSATFLASGGSVRVSFVAVVEAEADAGEEQGLVGATEVEDALRDDADSGKEIGSSDGDDSSDGDEASDGEVASDGDVDSSDDNDDIEHKTEGPAAPEGSDWNEERDTEETLPGDR